MEKVKPKEETFMKNWTLEDMAQIQGLGHFPLEYAKKKSNNYYWET